MTSQFAKMTSSSIFFDVVLCFLSSLDGASFKSISSLVLELRQFTFIRDGQKIQKSKKKKILVLPNIWRLEQVRDTKFGTDIFNEMLLNAAKCQGSTFTVSEVLRENQQGREGVKLPPFPPTSNPPHPTFLTH